MKKILFYFLVGLIAFACKSQQKTIDLKSKDVIVFNLNSENIHFVNNNYNQNINNLNNHNIVITQNWSGYGSHYFNKEYAFYTNKDTMTIKCFCGQNINYNFKNVRFQKGNFELKFNMPKERIAGSDIRESKKMQNILFKNATYEQFREPQFKNLYFKDLKFVKIDLNDSTNVKFKKIN